MDGGWRNAKTYEMDVLRPGNEIEGLAIIEASATTLVVPSGRKVRIDEWRLFLARMIRKPSTCGGKKTTIEQQKMGIGEGGKSLGTTQKTCNIGKRHPTHLTASVLGLISCFPYPQLALRGEVTLFTNLLIYRSLFA